MRAVTAVPRLTVELDSSRLGDEAAGALVAARLRERLGAPAQLELTFEDPPGPLAPVAEVAVGTPLRLWASAGSGGGAGSGNGDRGELFRGEVSAVEHAYDADGVGRVRLRAYDRLARLRRRRSLRVHVDVDIEGLARELVAADGLAVRAAAPGPVFPRLYQHRGSDLELLVATAARAGLHPVLRDDVLYLVALGDATVEGGGPVPLALGEELLEARFERNGEHALRHLDVRGWDPSRVEVHTGSARRDPGDGGGGQGVGADGGAGIPGVPGGATGGLATRDLGSRDRSSLDLGTWELAARDVADPAQAEALARGELERRAAGETVFWGVAEGSSRLRAGAVVEIAGVAAPFAGRHRLSAVTHTLDEARGWLCHLTSEPPEPPEALAAGAAPAGTAGAATAPARVTRVDDPEGWGRVRVSLPTYGDVESGWLGVVCPGAGAGKGLVAMPDVGDEVLVLLDQGDPSRALVLGGLFGTAGAPDSGVDDDRVRRSTWSTAGGRRVRLDDVRGSLRLEDGAGSFVELGPEGIRLHAAGDLEIGAPGHHVYIRAAEVDFERRQDAGEPPEETPPEPPPEISPPGDAP